MVDRLSQIGGKVGINTKLLGEAAKRIASIQSTSKWGVADEVAAAISAGSDQEAALTYLVAQVEGNGGTLTLSKAKWYYEVGTEWPANQRFGLSITAADELLHGSKKLSSAERFAIARTHGAGLTKRKARELAGGTIDYALGKNATTADSVKGIKKQAASNPKLMAALLEDSEFRASLRSAQVKREEAKIRSPHEQAEAEADAISDLLRALSGARRSIGRAVQEAAAVEGVAPIAVDRIARQSKALQELLGWVDSAFGEHRPPDMDAALQQLISDSQKD